MPENVTPPLTPYFARSEFERSLEVTLRFEGGYTNNPADHGKGTMCGITQAEYDAYRKRHSLPNRDVHTISKQEIENIYYNEYWLAAHCDKLTWPLNLCVFDYAVNSGVGRATRILKLVEDGHPSASPVEKANLLLTNREQFFHAIVLNNSTQQVFLNGWLSRVKQLRDIVGSTK